MQDIDRKFQNLMSFDDDDDKTENEKERSEIGYGPRWIPDVTFSQKLESKYAENKDDETMKETDILQRTKKTSHSHEPKLWPYYVSLPYPSAVLTNFEFVGCELGNLIRKYGDVFPNEIDTNRLCQDVERIIIIHDSRESVKNFCLRYFNAEPEIEDCTWTEISKNETANSSMVYLCILGRIMKNTKSEALESILAKTLHHVDIDKINFVISTISSYVATTTKARLEWIAEKKCVDTSALLILNETDTHGKELLINRFYVKRVQFIKYLLQKITSFSLPQDSEDANCRRKKVLKKLEELKNICKVEKKEDPPYDCKTVAETLQRIDPDRSIGFSLSRSHIQLYVQNKFRQNGHSERSVIDKIRQSFPELTITIIRRRKREQLVLKPHYRPGEPIHSVFNIPLGTLGMFGQLVDYNQRVAITTPHVIERGRKAIIRKGNDFFELGKCIWSPKRGINENFPSIDDIAVILVTLDTSFIDYREDGREVRIYDGTFDLENRRVFKYGATTNKTEGRVHKHQYNQFIEQVGKSVCFIVVKEVYGVSNFSEQGDSGAVVFAKDGTKYIALAIVYGGINFPELPGNMTAAIRLDDALDKFQDSTHKTLSLTRF